jgi:hypothetical protein
LACVSDIELLVRFERLTLRLVSFGTAYAPNILVTFVLESHPEFMPESLVAINVYFVFFMLTVLAMIGTAGAYKWHKNITTVNRQIYRYMV